MNINTIGIIIAINVSCYVCSICLLTDNFEFSTIRKLLQ